MMAGAAGRPAGLQHRPVEIVPYDSMWPSAFEEIKERVGALLGQAILTIDHIGSTSIPGLCAKPRIDVDIVVRLASDIPEAIRRLEQVGYEYRGNRYDDDMWAFTNGPGMRRQRLYVCPPDTPTHVKRLLFRDYLRGNREAADRYAALKRRLAVEFAGDVDGYTQAKGPFVACIVGVAEGQNACSRFDC